MKHIAQKPTINEVISIVNELSSNIEGIDPLRGDANDEKVRKSINAVCQSLGVNNKCDYGCGAEKIAIAINDCIDATLSKSKKKENILLK